MYDFIKKQIIKKIKPEINFLSKKNMSAKTPVEATIISLKDTEV